MNDDYLWDKSGEPDKEVQELEALLGTLRYQPRELAIPRDFQTGRRRNVYRFLAIAAALALVFAGLGVWRSLRQSQRHDLSSKAETSSPVTAVTPAPVAERGPVAQVAQTGAQPSAMPHRSRRPTSANLHRVRHEPGNEMKLSPSEIAEAEAAKQQLLLALRLTSAKLSLVQKRTQNTIPANLIRNQHKIG